jgi:hypothetical protein
MFTHWLNAFSEAASCDISIVLQTVESITTTVLQPSCDVSIVLQTVESITTTVLQLL